jgi:3',5'-nucleoside bisphosphate phosphatase
VIDLHLHTTASDGKLRPSALVALAARANLRVISVTDHDTVAGLPEAREAAAAHGLRLVNGIEVTAVERGWDVHVLGYFIDPENPELERFLDAQRADRVHRLREIGARLKGLGCEIDVEAIIATTADLAGRSVGRPLIADALVAKGLAIDRRDAFDRLLGNDGPAFVPRCGTPVARVAAVIAAAGGIASLAHPILLRDDSVIPQYAEAGVAALEVRHREHDEATEARYRALARSLNLVVSGGSDFHGEPITDLGTIALSAEDFHALEARVAVSQPQADRSV